MNTSDKVCMHVVWGGGGGGLGYYHTAVKASEMDGDCQVVRY